MGIQYFPPPKILLWQDKMVIQKELQQNVSQNVSLFRNQELSQRNLCVNADSWFDLIILIIEMQSRINELSNRQNYKQGLRQTCRKNKIKIRILNGLTITKFRIVYERTLKHYQANQQKAQGAWFENQLRLFRWVLIIESYLLNLLVKQFNQTQWAAIQTYFPPKNANIFEFQAKKFLGIGQEEYTRIWSQEECAILIGIMKDNMYANRWNDVSRLFFQLSGKRYFRSSKQCRQQWYNHLDQSKQHGEWKKDEDFLILEFVLKNGRKWAQMSKDYLPHRTEHMIKNRFKSLMTRGKSQKQQKDFNERKIIRRTLKKMKTQNQSPIEEEFTVRQSNVGLIKREGDVLQEQVSIMDQQPVQKQGNSQLLKININKVTNNQRRNHQQINQNSRVPQIPSIPEPRSAWVSGNTLTSPMPQYFTFNHINPSFNSFGFQGIFPNIFTFVSSESLIMPILQNQRPQNQGQGDKKDNNSGNI